ncbi:OPT oligopeptide transporter protein-domain-containing protein, partial [Syncephalis fuscata]
LARKALKSTDDPSLPCLTFRFWTISTLYVIFAAICSQLFYFRANFVAFSSFFVQFTAYPLGRLMEAILPTKNYSIGAMQFYLNPGPFNCKEHMLISVAVNAGGMAAYASDVIASEEIFFDLRTSSLLNLSILLTTQFIGFGLAGYLKEFLVRPTAMVWPVQLVQPEYCKQRGLTRQRLFIIVFCAAFAYHLLPLTVMPVLTSLSLICLAMPHNEFAQLLGSGMRGLGMGTLSFDWAAIGSVAPMYTPWWAQVNFFLGAIGVLWVVAPLLWSFDIWYARMFPIVSAQLFDEQGQPFAVWHIITSTFSIDTKKLASYSQLRMSPVFAISFGATLFALAASCTHVALYYGKDMLK